MARYRTTLLMLILSVQVCGFANHMMVPEILLLSLFGLPIIPFQSRIMGHFTNNRSTSLSRLLMLLIPQQVDATMLKVGFHNCSPPLTLFFKQN